MAEQDTEGPWERLIKLIQRIAETFAVSYQVIVVALLALFVIVITFLMIFFRIFIPNTG
jgi:hypothetical protein